MDKNTSEAPVAPATPPALLTIADLAFELRCSTRQVRRWLASGRLYPADFSLGGLRGRRWKRDRFLRWVNEFNCTPASAFEATCAARAPTRA